MPGPCRKYWGGSADGFFLSTLGCFGDGAPLVRASGNRTGGRRVRPAKRVCGSSSDSGGLLGLAGREERVERADHLGVVAVHACAAATLDGNTAALAHRCPAAAPVLDAPPLFAVSASVQAATRVADSTAATWDVFWSGQDAVRASRARIGVTCTSRALQRAAFSHRAHAGRGASRCPFISHPCPLPLPLLSPEPAHAHVDAHRNAGWSGEGRWLRCCVALSQIRPCNTSPVRMPNFAQGTTSPPGSALVIVRGLGSVRFPSPWPEGSCNGSSPAYTTHPPRCMSRSLGLNILTDLLQPSVDSLARRCRPPLQQQISFTCLTAKGRCRLGRPASTQPLQHSRAPYLQAMQCK